jgi:hypothetical protein
MTGHSFSSIRGIMLVVAAVLLTGFSGSAWAEDQPVTHSSKASQGVQHYLRVARLAEQRHQSDKALAAYQNVVAIDPSNKEAQDGIARLSAVPQSSNTKYTLELGGGYETNPAWQTPGTKPDWLGIARFDVRDERSVDGVQWRSIGQLVGDFYANENTFNYGYAGATTGPVFYTTPDYRVHPEIGVGTSMFSNVWFYNEAMAAITFESALWNGVQSVRLRLGYRDYNDFFPATHGFYGDVIGRYGSVDLLKPGDAFIFSPWYRHSEIGGTGFLVNFDAVPPGNYEEVGSKVEYYYPITEAFVLGGDFAVDWRQYEAAANVLTGIPQQRTDIIYSPGASVIFPNLLGKGVDLRADYNYDIDQSTIATDSFNSQLITSSVVMHF